MIQQKTKCISENNGQFGAECIIAVHVQPGAKRTALCGKYGDAYKISLQVPPVDGKANVALCKFVANLLNVPVRAVSVRTGVASRDKYLSVIGLTEAQVKEKLTI